MPYLDSNIPSSIYHAFIGSKILGVAKTTSKINTFIALSVFFIFIHFIIIHLSKRIQKEGSKHRFIRSILNKIFCKNFTIFNGFADTAAKFVKLYLLSWIRTINIHICFLQSLFLFIIFCFSVCLFVCLWGYHVIVVSVSSILVSMYLHLFMFQCIRILYCTFTIIWDFSRNCYLSA